MTNTQKLDLRRSEVRARLNEIAGLEGDAFTDEIRTEAGTLQAEYSDLEIRHRAAIVAEPPETVTETGGEDAEAVELRSIRDRVKFTEYVGAAMEMRGIDGAEAEFNQALKIPGGSFPLRLLAPEVRQTTGADATATQGTWLDRLFAVSAAARVGITMRSVAPGVASFPVTTAGATGEQQAKSEVTTAATWTVGVTEMRPKRGSVRAIFSIEDQARLPGLEDALQRDLRAALADSIDAAIFKGDSGPSGTASDIVGLQTAAITEFTSDAGRKGPGSGDSGRVPGALVDGRARGVPGVTWASSLQRRAANVLWSGRRSPNGRRRESRLVAAVPPGQRHDLGRAGQHRHQHGERRLRGLHRFEAWARKGPQSQPCGKPGR